jgi:hypothetical protein
MTRAIACSERGCTTGQPVPTSPAVNVLAIIFRL